MGRKKTKESVCIYLQEGTDLDKSLLLTKESVSIYLQEGADLDKSLLLSYNSYITSIRPESSFRDIRALGLNKFTGFIYYVYCKYSKSKSVNQVIY